MIKVRLMCVGAGPTLDYADAAEFLAGFEPIMTQRADVKQSPAYEVLRASSRRLLMFIEQEIARQGGGNVTLYADQLAVVGSVRVVLPGLSELNALGLIRDARYRSGT